MIMYTNTSKIVTYLISICSFTIYQLTHIISDNDLDSCVDIKQGNEALLQLDLTSTTQIGLNLIPV